MTRKRKPIVKPTDADLDKALEQLIDVLSGYRFNQPQLLALLSHLLLAVGASIEGFQGLTPPPFEIAKLNLEFPDRLGYALMAQAVEMNTTWARTLYDLIARQQKE